MVDRAMKFFRDSTFDAMQGPILVPPDFQNNPRFVRAQYKFRTISFIQYRKNLREIETHGSQYGNSPGDF